MTQKIILVIQLLNFIEFLNSNLFTL